MTDNPPNNSVQRLPSGQFAPGSGGRPIGSKNKISSAAMAAVKDMTSEAVMQLKKRLEAGDWQAIQYVLDKTIPKSRVVELDGITPDSVLNQMMLGKLSAAEAKEIAAALKDLHEITQMSEVQEKLVLLEAILKGK